jgi:hypothetical protein
MSPTSARWTNVVIGVAAATALAFSTQLPWWQFAEVEVFLTRARHCFEGECQNAGMAWMGASLWWHRIATATFGVGLLAALLAVFIAGARAAGRSPRTASGSLLVAVVTGMVCAAITLFTFPMLSDMGFGLGSPLYVGGLVLSAAAAVMARRKPAGAVGIGATPAVPGGAAGKAAEAVVEAVAEASSGDSDVAGAAPAKPSDLAKS